MEIGIWQPLRSEYFAGLPDCEDFGMSGRVVEFAGAVSGGGNDIAVSYNHRADRYLTAFCSIMSLFQRGSHVVVP